MKDNMKKNPKQSTNDFDVKITDNPPKVNNNQLNEIKIKPSLNELYEMKTNNSSDYSTETFEKLE